MKTKFLLVFLIFILTISNKVLAEEKIPVPTDPNCNYEALLLNKPTETTRILTTKQTCPTAGLMFTRMFIDCVSQTFRVTNEGDTFEKMHNRQISGTRMIDLVVGSSKYYQVQYACSK